MENKSTEKLQIIYGSFYVDPAVWQLCNIEKRSELKRTGNKLSEKQKWRKVSSRFNARESSTLTIKGRETSKPIWGYTF